MKLLFFYLVTLTINQKGQGLPARFPTYRTARSSPSPTAPCRPSTSQSPSRASWARTISSKEPKAEKNFRFSRVDGSRILIYKSRSSELYSFSR